MARLASLERVRFLQFELGCRRRLSSATALQRASSAILLAAGHYAQSATPVGLAARGGRHQPRRSPRVPFYFWKMETIMTEKSEAQFKAVERFARSVGRCVLRWPHNRTRPPAAWQRWRQAYSVRERISMFYEAGLMLDEERSPFDRLLEEAQANERTAWLAWRAYKRRVEAQYMAGRRKRAPHWLCC